MELVPFRAAIAAGVSSSMTAHLAVPALEPDPDVPATMSPKIMTDLLRGQMKFDGLVVTYDMGGVTVRYPPGEVAVRSILAGADVLLVPPVLDAALQGVREAVASGRIPMSRIDEAVTRVLRAKSRTGLNKSKLVDLDALARNFDRPEFDKAALDIADRGITLLRDDQHLLPLDAAKPARVLLGRSFRRQRSVPGGEPRERNLLAPRFPHHHPHGHALCARRYGEIAADTYDVAIAAVYVRVTDRKGSVGLPDDEAAIVNRLLAVESPWSSPASAVPIWRRVFLPPKRISRRSAPVTSPSEPWGARFLARRPSEADCL